MKRLLSVLALVTLTFGFARADLYRVRVFVQDAKAAQRVTDCGLELFSEQVQIGETDLIASSNEIPVLWTLGCPYRFVGKLPAPDEWKHRQTTLLDDYQLQYLRLDTIYAKFDSWMAANPTMVTKRQIGTSREGRPMMVYTIYKNYRTDANQPRYNIVLIYGIHAREWITESVGMYAMDYLLRDLKNPSSVLHSKLADQCAIHIVPCINPDGYVYTWDVNRNWRKNRRNNGNGTYGVDLNRNWATGFGGAGSSSSTSSDTYRGPSAFSEPENIAVRDFSLGLGNVRAFIDFHSYGQYVMWPWGYQSPPTTDNSLLAAIGNNMVSAIHSVNSMNYTPGQVYTVLYPASGVTIDWYYNQFRTRALTIELRDTGTYGFQLPEAQIYPTQTESFAALKSMIVDTLP